MGRQFGWLWASYAVSTLGTYLAFDSFPLIAILVLHAGPTAVSLLASAGLAVGALVAVPLGPWMEWRRKRPVMYGMDLLRFVALMTVPVAYAFGQLRFGQLIVVAIIVAAADIAFKTASGAYLKVLVRREDLLLANSRFESTMWTATALGPPLGGAAIGIFGPVTTVVANAVSFLLSACGLRAIGKGERRPIRTEPVQGFRARRSARRLAVHPGQPGTAPTLLQHRPRERTDHGERAVDRGADARPAGLRAMAVRPGFRDALHRRVDRFPALSSGGRAVRPAPGPARRRRAAGLLADRLALICRGVPGLLLVFGVEFALITCIGVFNPVYATYRLEQTPHDRVARVLSAWTVTSSATTLR